MNVLFVILQGRGRGVSAGQVGGMSSGRVGQGVGQQQIGGNQSTGGIFGSASNTSGATSSTAGGMMSGLMGSMMGGSNAQSQQNRPQHKGIPTVIPTLNTGMSPQSQQPLPQATQPQGPNLMQKLTDMTAPGGDILSKGKELIFMKFGLGGK